MKKFLLSLMLPLLMVMGAFAMEFDGNTDYEYDDVEVAFVDNEDGTFYFTITNDSGDDIYVNYVDSYFFGLDEDGEETAEVDLFDEDELDYYDFDDDYFIMEDGDDFESGDIDASEDADGDLLDAVGIVLVIEIDGEEYTWTAGAAE